MPSIRSIATEVPEFACDNSQILEAGAKWLEGRPDEYALFKRFVNSSQTGRRHFIKPLESILEFKGMKKRAELFETKGRELGLKAAQQALASAECSPEDFGTYIFTSCSVPVIPSIDACLLQDLNLSSTVTRLPIYQHGCAGGVIGLSLAKKFAETGSNVLLTSVELCSLGFHHGDSSAGQLVGSAIFADGAAAVVVSPEDKGLVFEDARSILTENSRHLMGYDVLDDGSHLRLDKELPSFLAEHIPSLVNDFLAKNSLTQADIAWWLFHPGGVKILNCLEDIFGLRGEQAIWSRNVLKNYGNLSSASVLFVLSDFMQSRVLKENDKVLMVGVGPGLTVELILFSYKP